MTDISEEATTGEKKNGDVIASLGITRQNNSYKTFLAASTWIHLANNKKMTFFFLFPFLSFLPIYYYLESVYLKTFPSAWS